MRHYGVGMAVLAALLLASCGGSGAPPSPTPESTPVSPVEPPTQPTVTVTSTPAPRPTTTAGPTATRTATATNTPAPPTATPVASATATPTLTAEQERVVARAMELFSQWVDFAPDLVTLDSIEAVTWTDGCLEVSRPGLACTQALVPGFRVLLRLRDQGGYEVRTDRGGRQFAWAPEWVHEAAFEGLSDSGLLRVSGEAFAGAIDPGFAQLRVVPGTLLGVVLETLNEGDLVVIGADFLPSSDVSVLVWIERAPE